MSVDRRSFIQAGAAAMAALTTACRGGKNDLDVKGTATLAFDFTGLFALEHWKDTKKMNVLLVDAVKAGLSHAAHAPLLVMRLSDYRQDQSTYHLPQIVWLGEPFALWILEDSVVWIDDVVQDPKAGDSRNSLTLDESTLPFVNMADVLGQSGPVTPVKERGVVAAELLLTRGVASARVPSIECERERTYTFTRPGKEIGERVPFLGPKKFASQMLVRHPVTPGTVRLRVHDRKKYGQDYSNPIWIAVNAAGDRDTAISIFNPAIGGPTPDHFAAFFKLVGAESAAGLEPQDACSSDVTPANAQQPAATTAATRLILYSPYARCIPTLLPQE